MSVSNVALAGRRGNNGTVTRSQREARNEMKGVATALQRGVLPENETAIIEECAATLRARVKQHGQFSEQSALWVIYLIGRLMHRVELKKQLGHGNK